MIWMAKLVWSHFPFYNFFEWLLQIVLYPIILNINYVWELTKFSYFVLLNSLNNIFNFHLLISIKENDMWFNKTTRTNRLNSNIIFIKTV